MKKVLLAHGQHGHNSNGWQWCNPSEPVGVHGFICSNACQCGCSNSFPGIDTTRSTTRAIVSEVSEDLYNEFIDRLRISTINGGWSTEVADHTINLFHLLSDSLRIIQVGTEVSVLRNNEHYILTFAPDTKDSIDKLVFYDTKENDLYISELTIKRKLEK